MDVMEKLEVIAHIGDHISYKEDIGIFYDSALAKVIEDAYMELKSGVTVQKWISVKDRLPEKNTSVLASTDKGIVFQCLYAYDGWDLWDGNEVNITHWQPMPQPTKGE